MRLIKVNLGVLSFLILQIIALDSCTNSQIKTVDDKKIVLANLDSISSFLYKNLSRNRISLLNKQLSSFKEIIADLPNKTVTDSVLVLKSVQEFGERYYMYQYDSAIEKMQRMIIPIVNEKDSLQKKILIKTFEIMSLEEMINNYYSGMNSHASFYPVAFKKGDSVYIYFAVINPMYGADLLLSKFDYKTQKHIPADDTNYHFKKEEDYFVSKLHDDASKLECCLRFVDPNDSTKAIYYEVYLNLKDY